MSQLFVFVLQDPNFEENLLSAWLENGVPGVTVMDSYGISHKLTKDALYDLPPLASLSSILGPQEESSLALFSVLPDDFDVDALIAVSEEIVGDLSKPNVGIAFTLPISRTWGLRR